MDRLGRRLWQDLQRFCAEDLFILDKKGEMDDLETYDDDARFDRLAFSERAVVGVCHR